MQRLVVNWLEKRILFNICCVIFVCCIIISCAPSARRYTSTQTQLQLGLAYIQLHQYDLAEKQLQQASMSKRNNFDGQRALAYLYQTMGKSEEAMHLYHEIIRKYPTSSQAYNNYGVFLCQQKQYQKALLAFDTALKNNSKNINAQKNSILCELKKQHSR